MRQDAGEPSGCPVSVFGLSRFIHSVKRITKYGEKIVIEWALREDRRGEDL